MAPPLVIGTMDVVKARSNLIPATPTMRQVDTPTNVTSVTLVRPTQVTAGETFEIVLDLVVTNPATSNTVLTLSVTAGGAQVGSTSQSIAPGAGQQVRQSITAGPATEDPNLPVPTGESSVTVPIGVVNEATGETIQAGVLEILPEEAAIVSPPGIETALENLRRPTPEEASGLSIAIAILAGL